MTTRVAKVSHFIPSLDDEQGGPVTYLTSFLEQEIVSQPQIVVASLTAPGAAFKAVASMVPTQAPPLGHLLKRFYGGWRVTMATIRGVSSSDIVVVHSFFNSIAMIAILLAKLCRKRRILIPHGSLGEGDVTKHKLLKRLMAPVWRFLLNRSNIVTMSEAEEKEITLYGANVRVRTIPPPLTNFAIDRSQSWRSVLLSSLAARNLQLFDDDSIFVFAGRLHPVKNLENLIRAFNEISNGQHALILVGSGAHVYERVLRELIADCAHRDRILLMGWTDRNQLSGIIAGSNAFVLVSHSENFGIAAAEALALGAPVILSHRVPIAEMVEQFDAGVITDTTAQGIAKGLRTFLARATPHMNRQALLLTEERLSTSAIRQQWLELLTDI